MEIVEKPIPKMCSTTASRRECGLDDLTTGTQIVERAKIRWMQVVQPISRTATNPPRDFAINCGAEGMPGPRPTSRERDAALAVAGANAEVHEQSTFMEQDDE